MYKPMCLLISLIIVTTTFADGFGGDFDGHWDYPNNSAGGVSESSGLVSFTNSTRRTTDSVEKVILWYAKRLDLPDEHELVEAAEEGFSNLDNRLSVRSGFGRDTTDREDHISMLGSITSKHAHVTMIYQPILTQKTDVVISITQTPDGTNIHVRRQEP
jgi:hypothetical protein